MKRLLSSALLVAALLPLSAFAGSYSFSIANTGASNPFSLSPGLAHGAAVTWGLGNANDGTNYTGLFNDVKTGGQVVTSATLTLTGIYDWANETTDSTDALYVHILAGLNVPTAAASNVGVAGVTQKVFDPSSPSTNTNWANDIDPFVDNTVTTSWNYQLQNGTTPLAFGDATANSLLKANAADTATGTPSTITWSDGSGTVPSTVVITFSAANLSAFTALLASDTGTGSPNVGLGFAAECHYYMSGVSLSVTTAPASVPDSGNTLVLMGVGLAALAGFRRSKK